MNAAKRNHVTVLVVSDSSGASASHTLGAASELFKGVRVIQRRHTMVESARRIREIVNEAEEAGAGILYTFANPELREEMRHRSHQHEVLSVDQSSPLIEMLSRLSGVEPATEPSHTDTDTWRDAVQFFLHCEDGQNPQKLLEAQAVLVGLSRTQKSPTCLHLAIKGIKAANVPLVLTASPPEELFQVEPQRVFVLSMRQTRLQEYRRTRLQRLGGPEDDSYVSRPSIIEECKMVSRLLDKNRGWREIDGTSMSSEEIAGRVIELLEVDGNLA